LLKVRAETLVANEHGLVEGREGFKLDGFLWHLDRSKNTLHDQLPLIFNFEVFTAKWQSFGQSD
jgi:hypothetical protein